MVGERQVLKSVRPRGVCQVEGSSRLCRSLSAMATASVIAVVAAAPLISSPASAASDADVQRLEKIILRQQKLLESQERRLRALEKRALAPRRLAGMNKVIPLRGANLLNVKELSVLRGGLATRAGIQILMPDGKVYTVPFVSVSTSGLTAAVAPQAPVDVPGDPPKVEKTPQPKAPVEPGDEKKTTKEVAPKGPVAPNSGSPPPKAPTGETARPKSEKAQEQLLLARSAILLRPGTLQVEPGVEYTRFSNSRVAISGVSIFEAIIIGLIRVDALDRDIVSGQLKARLGIFKRLQADISIPYIYRSDREVLGVGTPTASERTVSGRGIGDIEFGITTQPVIGGDGIPDILVRANLLIPTGESPFDIPTEIVMGTNESRLIRTPTGSGFYSAGATATFVWTSDPVVFFTGAGYQYIVPKKFAAFGRINPGNSLQFFAGLNLAVSDKVSLSLSFVNQRTFSTTVSRETSPGSSFSDSRLSLGASVAIAKNTNLLVSASAGLGEQSPDFVFSVRIPITFQLWK